MNENCYSHHYYMPFVNIYTVQKGYVGFRDIIGGFKDIGRE